MNYLKIKIAISTAIIFSIMGCQKELDSPIPDTQKIRVYFVNTHAGNELQANIDGFLTEASFNIPFGISSTQNGELFITDHGSNNIRRISKEGIVSSITPEESLSGPSAVQQATDGSWFVSESTKNRVAKVNPNGSISEWGIIELCDNQTWIKASLASPNGMIMDPNGDIYIADTFNHQIKKIDQNGRTTIIAGKKPGYKDGKGKNAQFYQPFSLAMDISGNLYVTDYGNNMIRKIDQSGEVSTVAGNLQPGKSDGFGNNASFYSPTGITIGDDGTIYIADYSNSLIRGILTNGEVVTIAGTDAGFLDGVGITAKFNHPVGLTIFNKILYIADSGNHRIRKIEID